MQRLTIPAGSSVTGTADVEGSVSNQRLQQFCIEHPSDITRLLQDLVGKGLLLKNGYGRGASYRLTERLARSRQNEDGTPDTTVEDSGYDDGSSSHNDGDLSLRDQFEPLLEQIAETARSKSRLTPEVMWKVLVALCSVRELTLDEIGRLLQRNPIGIRNRFLSPMVQCGQLQLRFPQEPNHPRQAYKTNPDWRSS